MGIKRHDSSPLHQSIHSFRGKISFIGTFLLGFLTAAALLPSQSSDKIPLEVRQALSVPQSKFQGQQWWKEGFTLRATTLYETSFARFQLHRVRLENGKVVDDWLWYDEADSINVLVETTKNTYLVFRQTKYAMEGRVHAVVGGLIEAGEAPLEAAQRELKEELGLQAAQWKSLGGFRAAANRGGGITHAFLAQKATPIPGMEHKSQSSNNDSLREGEAEHQTLLELSRDEVVEALMQGKFQEIKWTATVALAMLSSSGEPQEPNRRMP